MIAQRTLKNAIRATGIGLHSGRKIDLVLRPAPSDTGIVFSRTDLNPQLDILAQTSAVGDTTLATTLVSGPHRIATIEHLMAALAGHGIDNALVEVDAPEVPIMDGSAATFDFLIQSAGIQEQDAAKKFMRIKKRIRVADVASRDEYAQLEPFDGFRISHTIVYDNPVIKTQSMTLDFSTTSYIKEVSRARTFGLMSQVEEAQKCDLMLGASLDVAIGVDDYRVINPDGLRLENEFVRHKILDAIGDLHVLGYPIIGKFTGYKSGHKTHHALREAVLAQQDAWELVTFKDHRDAPISLTRPVFA